MRTLNVITPAIQYPVTLAEVKEHCRVDSTSLDASIQAYIAAATSWCEQFCNRAFCQQELELVLDEFPAGAIELPMGNAQSVVSVGYYDVDGISQIWADDEYVADMGSRPARIEPASGYTYPAVGSRVAPISVRWWAGYAPSATSPTDYAENVPSPVKTAIKLWVDAQLDRDKDLMKLLIDTAETLLWPYRIVI